MITDRYARAAEKASLLARLPGKIRLKGKVLKIDIYNGAVEIVHNQDLIQRLSAPDMCRSIEKAIKWVEEAREPF